VKSPLNSLELPRRACPDEAFWLLGDYFQILVDSHASRGKYCIIRHIMARPGFSSLGDHAHPATREFVQYEHGLVGVEMCGQLLIQDAGHELAIDRGVTHRVIAALAGVSSVLHRFEPGGMDEFYRAIGRPSQRPADGFSGNGNLAQRAAVLARATEFDVLLAPTITTDPRGALRPPAPARSELTATSLDAAPFRSL